MKKASDYTMIELKEKCKALGISSTGTKTELFNRLMEKDPTGGWMQDDEERRDDVFDEASNVVLPEVTPMRMISVK